MISLSNLNLQDESGFTGVCGPFFEHSPWIARKTWLRRPFESLTALHRALCETVASSTGEQQIKLIASHPDLVGNLARQGRLTPQSTGEQAAAGLVSLSDKDISAFEQYNLAYRAKFGFPFVICARENKKAAILAAFPHRLMQTRDQEIATALGEIYKIARLRLLDAVTE